MEKEFWFNTKTGEVEVGKQTLAVYRIGPFSSREEAQKAYEILKSRAEKWDEEDEAQS